MARISLTSAQFVQLARLAQHPGAHVLERRRDLLAAHQHSRPHQSLVLPGPGLALLVALEGTHGTDQQPRGAGRTQAHVHVIELTGVGLGSQHMNDALPQPGEELRAVDGFGAVGFALGIAIVDEHRPVRAMPQLDAADLAVADDDETRIAQAAIAALGLAVTGHRLAPGQGQHLIEDRLGQPGQVVADFHQGQVAGDLRGGYPQTVGQLEVTQSLHLLLQIVLGNARQALAQLAGQLRRQGGLNSRPSLSSSSSSNG